MKVIAKTKAVAKRMAQPKASAKNPIVHGLEFCGGGPQKSPPSEACMWILLICAVAQVICVFWNWWVASSTYCCSCLNVVQFLQLQLYVLQGCGSCQCQAHGCTWQKRCRGWANKKRESCIDGYQAQGIYANILQFNLCLMVAYTNDLHVFCAPAITILFLGLRWWRWVCFVPWRQAHSMATAANSTEGI